MAKVTTGEIDPDIVKALEAILLVAVEPVTVKLLAQVLEQPTSVVEVLCNRLAARFRRFEASTQSQCCGLYKRVVTSQKCRATRGRDSRSCTARRPSSWRDSD
jgi:hypothetical protein